VEAELVKVSLLLATKTDLFSATSEFLAMYYATKNYSIERKVKLYPGIIKLFDNNSDIGNFELLLNRHLELKKVKHKNKNQLILYQMGINAIKSYDDYIRASVKVTLANYDFNMLQEFLSEDKNAIFHYNNGVVNFEETNHVQRLVEFFSDVIYNFNSHPVLPDISSIKNINFLNLDENTTLSNQDSCIDVIQLPLFRLHSPVRFDAGQIKQIRTELNQNISAFYENFFEFNNDTGNLFFDNSSINHFLEFSKNNAGLLDSINNTLNENIFLSQIPKSNPELPDFTVSINFTNYNNLINIYNLFNLFPDNVVKYIRELIVKYTHLNNLTNFITITKTKND
jgi:hypothetical protein